MESSVDKTRDPSCLMKTHFLKPYVTSIDGPVAELPRRRRVSVSSSSDLKVLSLSNTDNGFRSPNPNFFLGFEELNETCNTSNTVDDDASPDPEVLPLSQLLKKLGEGFPARLKRPRKLRIARRMGSEIKKHKTGDCGGSVSIDVPLSELFHKELAKRTSEDLRGKRARGDDDDNGMGSSDDITISQLVKSRKKTGGDASGSLGVRRRDKDANNDSRICQELASVAPQELERRNEDKDEEETRSKAKETVVARQTCVDVNGRNNPEKKKTVIDPGTKEAQYSLHEEGEKPSRFATGSVTTKYKTGDCGASISIDVPLSELFHKELAKRTNEHLRDKSDKECNNDSVICQELASGDDECIAPQEIEPQTEENDEEETRIQVEEITILPPLKAGQTCDDEVDVNGSNNPEQKKKTVTDPGTKEGECSLHEDERLKQRKLTTKELALDLEARITKVEKTLATIRNWKTK
ncbi:unnamed protein product [Eruca vesicaria subsp. sativa]|uniref:Uncharacterized protein n=1 Tax=Eruca vesicaria subsp. sativa TaxID=29727 RepID=A0ABC8K2I2_ERUVS|nr:unnamed protein product [Eruca vesicaria subsp. sativa]